MMEQYQYPMELIENIKLGKKTATGSFKELLSEEELKKFYSLIGQTVEVIDESGKVHCHIKIKDHFEVKVSNPSLSVAQKECFDTVEAWQADCREFWAELRPEKEWNDDAVMLMQDFELVLVGMCGFVCYECPAYSKNINREEDRKKISDKWKELYGFEMEPEKIRCDGCYKSRIAGKELLHGDCEFKACAEGRQLERCTHCEEYKCKKLSEYLNAYKELSESPKVTKEDFEKYFKAHVRLEDSV